MRAQSPPHIGDFLRGLGAFGGAYKHAGVFKQVFVGVFGAGFVGARHGVRGKHESVVHKEYVESFYLEQAAFNSVFEIILDKYLKDVDFTVPTKINVNGKTIRKFESTNQN